MKYPKIQWPDDHPHSTKKKKPDTSDLHEPLSLQTRANCSHHCLTDVTQIEYIAVRKRIVPTSSGKGSRGEKGIGGADRKLLTFDYGDGELRLEKFGGRKEKGLLYMRSPHFLNENKNEKRPVTS